jgi:hypothetical protein
LLLEGPWGGGGSPHSFEIIGFIGFIGFSGVEKPFKTNEKPIIHQKMKFRNIGFVWFFICFKRFSMPDVVFP